MKVRIRKKNRDGVVRLESSGEIKEFMINEDFLKPKDAYVSVCFKGKESSGIIDLSFKEIEILNKEVKEKKRFLGDVEVMKFDK